jgi:methylase of polypeptide subunit release factors
MQRTTTGPHRWTINYTADLDGGGTGFGMEFVELVKERYGPVDHLFEWCSGPAFIGLNLLDHQLARQLTVSDTHKPAVDCVLATAEDNQIADKVQAYNTSTIAGLPTNCMFDLVVANPPHFLASPHDARLNVDQDWHIHREFFVNIGKHLGPNAHILLQENQLGSPRRQLEFAQMIESNGLRITDVFDSRINYRPDDGWYIYYIELMLA